MELLILDTDFQAVTILDTFESLLWVDRYNGCGEFEIYTPFTNQIMNHLQPDYYVWLKESDRCMIIENRRIISDVEDGKYLLVKGRSLESILDRRIVWGQTILSGNFQNGVKKLLEENVISPDILDRKIENFTFEESDDPTITSLTVDAQFTWTNIYETIKKLCSTNNVGFKIILSDNNKFIFKLYAGVDRSYDQLTNPYVIFSPNFDNLIDSEYEESKMELKTITLIAGEGEGVDRKTATVGGGSALSRRELYTDARDLSQTVNDVELTDEEYLSQLTQRGSEKLNEYSITNTFDAQAEVKTLFKYGQDFFLGDIVQIESEYGIASKARVMEIIYSQNKSGMETYPTFDIEKT